MWSGRLPMRTVEDKKSHIHIVKILPQKKNSLHPQLFNETLNVTFELNPHYKTYENKILCFVPSLKKKKLLDMMMIDNKQNLGIERSSSSNKIRIQNYLRSLPIMVVKGGKLN